MQSHEDWALEGHDESAEDSSRAPSPRPAAEAPLTFVVFSSAVLSTLGTCGNHTGDGSLRLLALVRIYPMFQSRSEFFKTLTDWYGSLFLSRGLQLTRSFCPAVTSS
jgi:hypothetical protein